MDMPNDMPSFYEWFLYENYQKHNASFNSWSLQIYKLKQRKWERIYTQVLHPWHWKRKQLNCILGKWEVASCCVYPKNKRFSWVSRKKIYRCHIWEREALNLLKNLSTSKSKVRGFQWSPREQNRDLQQILNTEVSCSAPTLELKEIPLTH